MLITLIRDKYVLCFKKGTPAFRGFPRFYYNFLGIIHSLKLLTIFILRNMSEIGTAASEQVQ